jgi:hypothetical protein
LLIKHFKIDEVTSIFKTSELKRVKTATTLSIQIPFRKIVFALRKARPKERMLSLERKWSACEARHAEHGFQDIMCRPFRYRQTHRERAP